MHICFIIDNSPLTKQTYNYTNGTTCTNTNITILETIKISVQTMLNDLSRNDILMKNYQTLHLFVTSNPHSPISSFQNGQLHFSYQLKEIKSSESTTFPAQTILFALRHISKFRILTQTQTLLGYRQGTIYEPSLIIFISYGLTLRKISQIQSANIYRQMRSQYKFGSFRLCYPSQIQKEKSLEKYRQQIDNSIQSKKLMELAQKLNKGQHKNIMKYTGKQCLSDMLVRLFTNYRPSLSCNFIFDSDNNKIKMQFPQYFINSELGPEILMLATENTSNNVIKVQLLVKNDYQRNTNHGENISNRNLIPLPFEAVFKQETNFNKIQYNIQQVNTIQFYIDISKKLSKNLSVSLPTISYNVSNTNTRLTKLEKQLQRLGINQIAFPVYSSNTAVPTISISKKQKDFYLLGFLHYVRSYKQSENYCFSLIVSYPDFPLLDWIVGYMDGQRVDNRKLEKLLGDYHMRIPQFYYKFIGMFFKRQANHKPIYSIYQILSINNWANVNTGNTMNTIRSNKYKQLQMKQHIIQNARNQEKIQLEKLFMENMTKHINNMAECCPIYNDLNLYKNFMRSSGQKNHLNNLTSTEAVLSQLINKISQFNQKNEIKSYFGGRQAIRQSPMAREIDKYMQKNINTENSRFGQINNSEFAAPNQTAYTPIGLNTIKKVKRSTNNQSQQGLSQSQQKIDLKKKDDIFESLMPQKIEEFLEQRQQMMDERQKQSDMLEVGLDFMFNKMKEQGQRQNPNSINFASLKQNQFVSEVSSIKQVERQLIRNKMDVQKKYLFKNKNYQHPPNLKDKMEIQIETMGLGQNESKKVLKKSSSIEYSSGQEGQEGQNRKQGRENIENIDKKSEKLLGYVNKIGNKNKQGKNGMVKMNINLKQCKIKEGRFEQNLLKLKVIGLVKDIEKFIDWKKQ